MKRKSLIGKIVAICLAFAIFALPLFAKGPQAKVYATSTAIGELLPFGSVSEANVNALLAALPVDGLNITSISTNLGSGTKTHADMKDTISTVTFAGYDWLPVYLSKSTSGDVVLTLWLEQGLSTEDNGNEKLFYRDNGEFYDMGNWVYGGVPFRDVVTGEFEWKAIEYEGSSDWWLEYKAVETALRDLAAVGSGTSANYLVAPRAMGWQMSEDQYFNDPAYDYADVLDSENTAAIAAYDDWYDDLMWTPSLSEIGHLEYDWDSESNKLTYEGLWKIDDDTRSSGGTIDDYYRYWVRSSSDDYVGCKYIDFYGCAINDGDSYTINSDNRPAIHLNLSELASGVTPVEDPSPSQNPSQGGDAPATGVEINVVLPIVLIAMTAILGAALVINKKPNER